MAIRHLTYKEIDKSKWDGCIRNAMNSLIYGYSFYLDAMSANWDALVLGDYEAVMPLTWKSKWGIKYLYQPAFIQQSGIFFTKDLTAGQTRSFIEQAFIKFKFAEVTLNFLNETEWADQSVQISYRNNFIIDLNKPYDALYQNYDPAFTKSLRRIKKFGMLYVASLNYQKTIELYKYLYGKRLSFFSGKSYSQFETVCKKLFKENSLVIRHARSTDNQLLASVIFLRDEKRLYNIISCITTQGKQLEANYFLYDRIINEFANQNILLDFEGSDVDGIATFYKKFNPQNQPYPFIRHNNLSRIARMFKP